MAEFTASIIANFKGDNMHFYNRSVHKYFANIKGGTARKHGVA